MSADVSEIEVIKIVRRSKVLQGAGLGLLTGFFLAGIIESLAKDKMSNAVFVGLCFFILSPFLGAGITFHGCFFCHMKSFADYF